MCAGIKVILKKSRTALSAWINVAFTASDEQKKADELKLRLDYAKFVLNFSSTGAVLSLLSCAGACNCQILRRYLGSV